jgi:hypothetical protein
VREGPRKGKKRGNKWRYAWGKEKGQRGKKHPKTRRKWDPASPIYSENKQGYGSILLHLHSLRNFKVA